VIIVVDHYYMSSVIAELLRAKDIPVTLVTPETTVSAWGGKTGEQGRVQRRLMELDVQLITTHGLASFNGREAQIECAYTCERKSLEVEAVVTVTMRSPNDALFHELQQCVADTHDYRPDSLTRIGDCLAPSIIAGAVFSGHRYARELDTEVDPDNRMKYDRIFFNDD
jgi:dimethylamine/trimethylamine dehydrogenase